MPNRIIKESICTSDNIDQLTPFEETLFVRLMVNCDDYGRFDGRPKILSARLYPLKQITPEQIKDALDSLVAADLVTMYEVDGKPFLHLNSWEKHQQRRANKSKYPAPDNITCNQMISDDIKCARNRNRIRNTINDNRESESFITDDAAKEIQSEQNRILDAAEDAGFQNSNSVRAGLIQLYAEHGLEKVLNGIASCVEHGATNLAYLKACMKDRPKTGKTVKAQQYEQRDYTDVQNSIEAAQTARVLERLKGERA